MKIPFINRKMPDKIFEHNQLYKNLNGNLSSKIYVLLKIYAQY